MNRVFEKEYLFRASVERVWQALTDPEEMSRWMGHRVIALELRPGGRLEVEGLHAGTIRELEPPRRMVWAWDPDDGSQPMVETITLHPADGGTRVEVHVVAQGRWAEDLMYFSGVEAGWEGWLQAINQLIETGTVPEEQGGGLLEASLGAEEIDGKHRLFVKRVKPGGAAEAAGLQVGDTLRSWNGKPLERVATFWRLFWSSPPGAQVRLEVERSGQLLTLELVLAQPKAS
ncbi:MAG: SRPBCC domain-containing protein [Bacillota bacterium]